jgi:hypothetical protein
MWRRLTMQAAPYGAGREEPSCFPKTAFQADLKLNLCQDPPPIRQAPRQEVLPLGVDAVLLWLRKRVKRTLLRISFAMLLNHSPFFVRARSGFCDTGSYDQHEKISEDRRLNFTARSRWLRWWPAEHHGHAIQPCVTRLGRGRVVRARTFQHHASNSFSCSTTGKKC